ncbi:hypothetical protein CKL83_27355 [Bacillus anthracis]|uniref:Uncharacterized protein n=1 Tax=Bacillus cereus (strain 03BB102) TaxID=572264 RepID=A0A125YA21_BACC3|nr:hypothetical protein BCA_A0110 [Bacillus cereus 03BB102]AHE87258.2 hypothetical protein A16R_61225 [Bacillus anthracis str. A16R]AIF59666.1 hypothetical protein HYU01_28595 [Bacillus anthracis]AJZ69588.1 hypothetical protein A16_60205 [Bacillus anthracis str. A16]EJT17267.1 hypothetical protein B353_30693 [Bacillus anthracis str. UR-1]EVT89390.1 hypothetical protein U368_28575 [Bacillus anthracis 8903-G]EVT95351.1 hypothetical protein U365_27990 [Bacillus anthracis 9080-G]EVU01997.1 hypot
MSIIRGTVQVKPKMSFLIVQNLTTIKGSLLKLEANNYLWKWRRGFNGFVHWFGYSVNRSRYNNYLIVIKP